jgi:hypothetical protein
MYFDRRRTLRQIPGRKLLQSDRLPGAHAIVYLPAYQSYVEQPLMTDQFVVIFGVQLRVRIFAGGQQPSMRRSKRNANQHCQRNRYLAI